MTSPTVLKKDLIPTNNCNQITMARRMTTTPKTKGRTKKFYLPREDMGYSRTVSYNNKDHWKLITQRWGSINHKLLPLCMMNVAVCCVILVLQHYGIDMTMSVSGHELMSVLLAFLVTTTLSSALDTYYELQGYIEQMCQSAIDVAQLSCTFSSYGGDDDGKVKSNSQDTLSKCNDWRYGVCYYATLLLKVTGGILLHGGAYDVWKSAEFDDDPLLLNLSDKDEDDNDDTEGCLSRVVIPKELYVVGHNLRSDLNLRVPVRVSQRLQREIMKHRNLPRPITDFQEAQLMDRIQTFMEGYRGCRKYETAPMPLPLVQLGRIFVFSYVFTLPMAILDETLGLKDVQSILMVFLISYGFLGCELLFTELDDPFAEDPNDLPLVEEIRAAIEDIVISLQFVNGKDSASKLSKVVKPEGGWVQFLYEEQVRKNQPVFPIRKNNERIFESSSSRKAKYNSIDETDSLL